MNSIRAQIIERDEVIRARQEAHKRLGEAHPDRKKLIYSEFLKPLNERLLILNRALGL